MTTGIFDLLSVCIGPSSSHTTGPMRAARRFVVSLQERALLGRVAAVKVELYGSLAATGAGHATDHAVVMGLEGEHPETVVVERLAVRFCEVEKAAAVRLMGEETVPFRPGRDIVFRADVFLPRHPNGMLFRALSESGTVLDKRTYYSIGGGALIEGGHRGRPAVEPPEGRRVSFGSMRELLAVCAKQGISISAAMLWDESRRHPESEVVCRLQDLWSVMQDCVQRGLRAEGLLPGSLGLRRRAPALYRALTERPEESLRDPLSALDWVTLYALAVSEENACGGRVVSAPTAGTAGILPAVLHYTMRFRREATQQDVVTFLLTAAAIGILFRDNASISGADVGCQGEVGVACSMAAAGLTEVLGGTPAQVEAAAEIAMEHNLGLTCDPIAGLVQVPCVERNAMAAVKAITAARLALRGDGEHLVSLDAVIETMLRTGRDMREEYKETARGGLARTVGRVPVNVVEC